jgi:molecular chaperone DnaK
VLATAGNTFLGGDDIDAAIADHIVDQLLAPVGGPQGTQGSIWQEHVRSAAESLKRELSVHPEAVAQLPADSRRRAVAGVRRQQVSMTRAELEGLVEPIIDRTFDVCREALGLARVLPDQIERVLLVGGTTRMPLVRRRVEAFFGRPPLSTLNPDEVVALGAALQAEALAGGARRRSTIPAPPSSRRLANAQMGLSKPPSIGDLIASKTPPGQAATSIGAPAYQSPRHAPSSLPAAGRHGPSARLRSGQPSEGASADEIPWPSRYRGPPVLVDVTPLTLSVETVDGYCDAVIARNMTVPCERRRTFVTAVDHQDSVRISVGQGESRLFAENTLLGEIELDGIRPAPRGQVPIEVVFALDRDGILNVSAVDTTTRKATSATLRLMGSPQDEYLSTMRQRQSAMRSTDG